MTDYHSLSVTLIKDTQDENAQHIIDAIGMIKGVLSVKPHVADIETNMAEDRARSELSKKLLEGLYPQDQH